MRKIILLCAVVAMAHVSSAADLKRRRQLLDNFDQQFDDQYFSRTKRQGQRHGTTEVYHSVPKGQRSQEYSPSSPGQLIYSRQRRQAQPNSDELDDRYGWEARQNGGPPPFDRQFNQGQFPRPNQGQFGPFPQQGNQFRPNQGDQGQFGQFPGQGQLPNQGNQFSGQESSGEDQFGNQGNQFPGQGNFDGQGQFPSQGQFGSNQNQFPDQSSQTPPPATNGQSTQSPAVDACIRACPVTAEYNPVCGTDNQTYPNPGRLFCARSCGVPVNQLRAMPCPTTTTAAPAS